VRILSRHQQTGAMEQSTIVEGGRSGSAGCLIRTMGRSTISPVKKYELDGYNKAGGTALLLCSLCLPKLHFFTDVNV
jgi:hypothetical protein